MTTLSALLAPHNLSKDELDYVSARVPRSYEARRGCKPQVNGNGEILLGESDFFIVERAVVSAKGMSRERHPDIYFQEARKLYNY